MSEKVPGGYVVKAPHAADSIPRTCWTCLKHLCVISGMTTCYAIKDKPNHTKMGINPCEEYEMDPIWLEVDWLYINKKELDRLEGRRRR
ncbi:MAG: hypothetical protein IKN41_04950 [Candidatus Methanomethylophilaceae archaeon]|nr:hypothetical protein [Candidatus Methanomethylophilaceae archaeon]